MSARNRSCWDERGESLLKPVGEIVEKKQDAILCFVASSEDLLWSLQKLKKKILKNNKPNTSTQLDTVIFVIF